MGMFDLLNDLLKSASYGWNTRDVPTSDLPKLLNQFESASRKTDTDFKILGSKGDLTTILFKK